ncbi:DUF551 domain-containing protein [Klebsiella variicola]|uniref:DUF551 domain-containing protein n=1 Tax=Klebsiella variicola TaxID=244366 RepID=UPI001CCDB305|nr:DUF551 domain-containing protein [Klebsiella variicola]MBZ7174608.1 DUF551 domain-containing protein [Klebsiella variicola]
MTKSTITREQAQKIIVAADEVITALAGTNEDVHPDDSKKMCELWDDLNDRHAPPVVVRELARMALAAMNGEPFAYIIQDKYERERGVEGHLSRSHVSKYVSQEDINEHEITCIPLYRHAQQPVVPDDVLEALQKVARIRLDLNDFDGDRRGIVDCLGDAEEALIEVVNRRAAMLAASPQLPGSESATVPGKWIPVSERVPTKQDGSVFLTWNGQYIGKELFLMGSFQCLKPEIITHWMPLPAAPQEVKGE